MLAEDPDERIGIDDLLKHKYFEGETATKDDIVEEFK